MKAQCFVQVLRYLALKRRSAPIEQARAGFERDLAQAKRKYVHRRTPDVLANKERFFACVFNEAPAGGVLDRTFKETGWCGYLYRGGECYLFALIGCRGACGWTDGEVTKKTGECD